MPDDSSLATCVCLLHPSEQNDTWCNWGLSLHILIALDEAICFILIILLYNIYRDPERLIYLGKYQKARLEPEDIFQ